MVLIHFHSPSHLSPAPSQNTNTGVCTQTHSVRTIENYRVLTSSPPTPPPDAALGQAPCPCSLHICRNKNTDWGRKGGRKKEQRKEGGRWGEKKGDRKANGRDGQEGGKMRKILREGELNDEHAT